MAYLNLSDHYQITCKNHKEDAFLLHENENKIIKANVECTTKTWSTINPTS